MKLILPYFVVSTLILAGCASSPDVEVEGAHESVPSAWQQASPHTTDSVVDGWVASWNSPELQQILLKAEESSLDLRIAASRMNAALSAAGIERARGIPTLAANASAGRAKANVGDIPLTQTNDRFTLGLTLNWELDIWGRLRNLRSAAIADAEAASLNYSSARLSLLATVAKAWFNVIETERQYQLSRGVAESFASNARRAENLFRRGTAEALDVRLLSAQSESAQATLQSAAARRDQAARQLSTLLGGYPELQQNPPTEFPPFPQSIPVGTPSDLLLNRPDVIAAERRLAAAEQRYTAAKKQRLPAINLTASGGTASSELRDLTNSDFSVWSLLGNASAPIFQGGAIRANIGVAEANHAEALAAYAQTMLEGFREVETALANEQYLLLQAEALNRAASAATSAETTAWGRYERGLVDIATVLEAQRRAFETRSSLISAQNALHQNRINLLLALGSDPFLKD